LPSTTITHSIDMAPAALIPQDHQATRYAKEYLGDPSAFRCVCAPTNQARLQENPKWITSIEVTQQIYPGGFGRTGASIGFSAAY